MEQMKKPLAAAVLYLFMALSANAQFTQQWVGHYNGPGNSIDSATAIALDGAGNVYVTGRSAGAATAYD